MFKKKFPVLTFALFAAMAGTAVHADPGLTREQVRAETLAAMRNGDMVMPSGATTRSVFPGNYPPAPAASGATQSEVDAQTQAAMRNGDMVMPSGATARTMFPGRYAAAPAAPAASGPTRDEVITQTQAAIRNGDMVTTSGLTARDVTPGVYPPGATTTPAEPSGTPASAGPAEAARSGESAQKYVAH
jgi:hypothetical protein